MERVPEILEPFTDGAALKIHRHTRTHRNDVPPSPTEYDVHRIQNNLPDSSSGSSRSSGGSYKSTPVTGIANPLSVTTNQVVIPITDDEEDQHRPVVQSLGDFVIRNAPLVTRNSW